MRRASSVVVGGIDSLALGVVVLLALGVAACGTLDSPATPSKAPVTTGGVASIRASTVEDAPVGKLNICHYPAHGAGRTGTDRDFLLTGGGGFCNADLGGNVITVSCYAEKGHDILVGNDNQQDYREQQCGRRTL